jgi:hypothetical protein
MLSLSLSALHTGRAEAVAASQTRKRKHVEADGSSAPAVPALLDAPIITDRGAPTQAQIEQFLVERKKQVCPVRGPVLSHTAHVRTHGRGARAHRNCWPSMPEVLIGDTLRCTETEQLAVSHLVRC